MAIGISIKYRYIRKMLRICQTMIKRDWGLKTTGHKNGLASCLSSVLFCSGNSLIIFLFNLTRSYSPSQVSFRLSWITKALLLNKDSNNYCLRINNNYMWWGRNFYGYLILGFATSWTIPTSYFTELMIRLHGIQTGE